MAASSDNAVGLRLELLDTHGRLAICQRTVERLESQLASFASTFNEQAALIAELRAMVERLVPAPPGG
jgi:hypothetical protein